MSEKNGYKYDISFDQSVSSGIIKFAGHYAFDDPKDFDPSILVNMLAKQEKAFTNHENKYKVASMIPNNLRQMATANAAAKHGVDTSTKAKDKEEVSKHQ